MFSFSLVLVLLSAAVTTAHDTVLAVHGSGTTNPSQCYWNVMDEIMTRTKQPTRLTYRAVGSSTGRVEFINQPDPAANFGSGDIPLTTEQWQGLQDAGITALHLPVLVGAVGVFHSVPTIDNAPLNLTGCVLARIYTGELTDWGDAAVTQLNPNMNLQSNGRLPIKVARRVRGSSSTSAFTEFMSKSCPSEFSSDLASSLPDWPSDTGVLPGCEGSGGMSQCVKDNVGAIAYIDAGHGQRDGLPEVRLPRNSDETDNTDQFWTSAEAQQLGGIAQAEDGILPADASGDFGDVSLINRPGGAWPMVLLTYIYVRQDLSFMDEPDERGLLVAFLKSIYDENFVAVCRDEYGFILPSETIRSFGLNAIATLEQNNNMTAWTFEAATSAIEGQGEYVISVKRKSVKDLERDRLTSAVTTLDGSIMELEMANDKAESDIAELESTVTSLEAEVASLLQTVNRLQEILLEEGVSESVLSSTRSGSESSFGSTEETQLKASLAMSSIAFIGVLALAVMSAMGKKSSGESAKTKGEGTPQSYA